MEESRRRDNRLWRSLLLARRPSNTRNLTSARSKSWLLTQIQLVLLLLVARQSAVAYRARGAGGGLVVEVELLARLLVLASGGRLLRARRLLVGAGARVRVAEAVDQRRLVAHRLAALLLAAHHGLVERERGRRGRRRLVALVLQAERHRLTRGAGEARVLLVVGGDQLLVLLVEVQAD